MKRWKKMMIGSIVLGMSLVFGACGNQEGSSEESANELPFRHGIMKQHLNSKRSLKHSKRKRESK